MGLLRWTTLRLVEQKIRYFGRITPDSGVSRGLIEIPAEFLRDPSSVPTSRYEEQVVLYNWAEASVYTTLRDATVAHLEPAVELERLFRALGS